MKWPYHAARRSPTCSGVPARSMNTTPVPGRLSTSRYERFGAERVMTPCLPAPSSASIQPVTLASHAGRSSPVSGCPACGTTSARRELGLVDDQRIGLGRIPPTPGTWVAYRHRLPAAARRFREGLHEVRAVNA